MSDSFADLWASSAPTNPTPQQPQKKVGSTVPPRRQQYDTFSILSASQPSSKLIANNQLGARQVRQPHPPSNGGDAFSDLFAASLSGAIAGRNPGQVSMTIAERATLAQKINDAQNDAASTSGKHPPSSASLWAGLDALARPATASPRPTVTASRGTVAADSIDFEFGSMPTAGAVPSTTSPPNSTLIENDDWGLSEFASHPPESRSVPAPTKSAFGSPHIFTWAEFGSTESQAPQPRPQIPSPSITSTPGDFDFGDREDRLIGGEDSDAEDSYCAHPSHSGHPKDDILGDLAMPVSHSHSPSPNPSLLTRDPVRSPRATTSPPPHITGQLVEMGFSPIDARAALANTMTENDFDVQAAAELLLSQADQERSTRSSPQPPDRQRRRNDDRDRDRMARLPPSTLTESHLLPPNTSQTQTQSQPQLDVTAERLLSQASEFGRGMFSKANALWKEGKERAVKMYEERAATGAANSAAALDGRPRWMRDRAEDDWRRLDRMGSSDAVQGRFKDDEDEEQEGERREGQRPPARCPPRSQPHSPAPRPERECEVDLFNADSPTTYQSPFRRGKVKPQEPPAPSLPVPTFSSQMPISASSGPLGSQQPSQFSRTFTTTIALSTLTTSTSHKSSGTDAYKRGDFPVALTAYMRALAALPPEHILRVPILTNVAVVRSKVGELREAIRACEEAIVVVRQFVSGASGNSGGGETGMSFAATEMDFDVKMPVEVGTGKVILSVQGDEGAISNRDLPRSVDLVEGLAKAFRRRAEALEGLEKWEAARSTWEVLLGAEWAGAGVKGEAVKGVSRCRRMVDVGGGVPGSRSAPPEPKPKSNPTLHPRPEATTESPPSTALTTLRSTHDAQQTEDAARLAFKDAVDARLAAWKSGREGNIRALLTSLDETVLWSGLGWRKVGMAEVVSKGQVKGAYVRAIARVHPDKLNAGNTTVEQRMIANGVFGTLNEAWNAFQQQ